MMSRVSEVQEQSLKVIGSLGNFSIMDSHLVATPSKMAEPELAVSPERSIKLSSIKEVTNPLRVTREMEV